MPPNDEVKTRISAEDQFSEVYKKLIELEKKLEQQTDQTGAANDKAGRQAQSREQKLRGLNRRLEEIVRAEIAHERRVESGTKATKEDLAASERRQRQIQRLGGVLGEQERAHRRVNEVIRKSAGDADNATISLTKMLGGVRGLVGGLTATGGLLAAYRAVKAELQLIVDLQDKAFRKQVDLATATRSLKLNLAGESTEAVANAIASADRIAQRRGISKAQSRQALSEAISSTGGDLGFAERFTDLAAQLRPDQPGQIGGIAGALGDVANAVGTDDEQLALGFFLRTAGLSRIANSERQFRNIPVAIKGITGAEFSGVEAGALFAALTRGSADPTGESTGTAAISFAEQIRKFFIEKGRPERGGAAISALQGDAGLAEEFLANLSLEQKQAASARELLLDRGSNTAQYFASNLAKFGTNDSLRAQAGATLTGLNQGQVESVAATHRALGSTIDAIQTTDDTAIAGAVRDQLVELLQSAGLGDIASKLSSLRFEVGSGIGTRDVLQTAIGLINERRQALIRPQSPVSAGTGAAPGFVARTPTARERQVAGYLGNLGEQLQAISDGRSNRVDGVVIQVHNGDNYNVANTDGTTHKTELPGRDDL